MNDIMILKVKDSTLFRFDKIFNMAETNLSGRVFAPRFSRLSNLF